MKILFISYLSQPSDRIGAVRPSNLVQWLSAFGHEVTLVTSNPDAAERFDETVDVQVVRHSDVIQKGQDKLAARAKAKKAAGEKPHDYIIPNTANNRKKLLSREMFYSVRLWVWTWLCQQDWVIRCKRFIRGNLKREYDVVLSCFGPLGCILLGRWAHRRGYGRMWVSDMRDPIAVTVQNPMEYWYSQQVEKSVLRRADRVVMVSAGEAEYMRSLAANDLQREKVTFLENGFEPAGVKADAPNDGILRIVYTGQLYANRSDATALLKAARRVSNKTGVTIQIHYAGPHSYQFMAMAKNCGSEALVEDHGMLPREQALALQTTADILCVLTWNDHQAAGHLPGKFWEYLRADKPILSLCSGSVPEAELTRRVREMGVGFAFEYAAADESGLENYLRQAAENKSAGLPVPFEPVADKVLDYRYDNRAKRMADICRSVLESKGQA